MIYLDNASTTQINETILDAFLKLLKKYYANESSSHASGIEVSNLAQLAKEKLLEVLKIKDYKVLYTSGATEANNIFLKGIIKAYPNRGKKIITSKLEHPSVLRSLESLAGEEGEIVYVNLQKDGQIDYEHLKTIIDDNTLLVCLMAVNNEVGTITDIKKIHSIIASYPKVFFFSDVTQAIGKVDIDYNLLDGFSFSAHKIHGIKGSGALIIKKNLILQPLIDGGLQQYGLHSGTINSPSNIVLTKTVRLACENIETNLINLRKVVKPLIDYVSTNPLMVLNSDKINPYIVNFSLTQHKASIIVQSLANSDIMVSSLSACSAKTDDYSYVINNIYGDLHRASNAVRVSLSKDTTIDEIKHFIQAIDKILKETRKTNEQ